MNQEVKETIAELYAISAESVAAAAVLDVLYKESQVSPEARAIALETILSTCEVYKNATPGELAVALKLAINTLRDVTVELTQLMENEHEH